MHWLPDRKLGCQSKVLRNSSRAESPSSYLFCSAATYPYNHKSFCFHLGLLFCFVWFYFIVSTCLLPSCGAQNGSWRSGSFLQVGKEVRKRDEAPKRAGERGSRHCSTDVSPQASQETCCWSQPSFPKMVVWHGGTLRH